MQSSGVRRIICTLGQKWRHFVNPKTLLCFRIGLGLELGLRLSLGLGRELAEIRFRLNVLSSKRSRSVSMSDDMQKA